MRSSKLLLSTIGATALLAALVGSASARSLSVSSQTMRALFTTLRFSGIFGTIVCEIAIEGSLHSRTIAKVVGSLIGYITELRILRCATNTVTILRETLPWHIRYGSFSSALPNITTITINIVGVAFQIREPAFTCLARSTEARPVIGTSNREAGGALTTVEVGGTVPTNCLGTEGTFSSSRANITVLNSASRITVTLI